MAQLVGVSSRGQKSLGFDPSPGVGLIPLRGAYEKATDLSLSQRNEKNMSSGEDKRKKCTQLCSISGCPHNRILVNIVTLQRKKLLVTELCCLNNFH